MPNLKLTNRLDVAVFVVVATLLIILLVFLAANLTFQYLNYREGIRFAFNDREYIDHANVITYSRAWDFAVVKTSALFFSFMLIFTGALYVLRAGETTFELKAENTDFKGSLSLSSPGLVMVTLGVFLAAYVISTKTYIEYNVQRSESRQEIRQRQKPSKLVEPNDIPSTL